MGKPRMIILIRHAQSEGNKNRDIHQTIPDHRVKLTPLGWTQAYEAGRRLRSLLRADDTLHFFTSPYRRTRETTEGILSTLTSDEPSPTPFPRNSIKVYEEPRLREQDFGNFQPCSAEMERMWQERADYGHFFYRIPNGESAADAYDRISGFNESLWRQFGEDDCASVCVLVTHGLMSRVFLMKWYHFSVEYFEDLRNVNHCEFLIMRKKEDSGKYILENNLRTWSELKRERMAAVAAAAAGKEKLISTGTPTTGPSEKDKGKEKKLLEVNGLGTTSSAVASGISSPAPIRKKWGGCPNGCDHGKHYYSKQKSINAMQLNGRATPLTNSSIQVRRPARRWQSSSEEDEDDLRGILAVHIDHSLDDIISSPDGTPSSISIDNRLRSHSKSQRNEQLPVLNIRQDFDGSLSGNTSPDRSSDCDFSAEEDLKRGKPRVHYRKVAVAGPGNGNANVNMNLVKSGMRGGSKADALGDQSDAGSDEDLAQAAAATENSVHGSVY